ncbi:MAG: anaerobic sulfatase maturase [Epulopiscium sp. Nuni2H_MBin001]|nr:MAG: anaerobic sulfatase maturase [Epulopiscium sp. Nuni2H_MBin001]
MYVLIKPASSACNMNCDYCFYNDVASKRTYKSYGMMTEATLKNVIRKTILKASGQISYAFQGGEPTLMGIEFFRKAVAFQQQYNRNNVKVYNSLQTNGLAIDKQWCQFLHDNNFLVGISIDGIQSTHNAYRRSKTGEPTFDKVVSATKLLDMYDVEYNILTVVNSLVASNISSIYSYYKKRGWKFQQYIACLDPLDKAVYDYCLSPQLFGKFMIELFDLWFADFQKGSQPYIRQFENYIGILNGYHAESCDMRGFCSVQTVVEADGSVFPCDFYVLDKYLLGNFNENQLAVIDDKRSEIEFITDYNASCKTCEYFYICRGGCKRSREGLCDGYKMFFDATIERMVSIKI